MKIKMMEPGGLIPWKHNGKAHPEEQIAKIARSIREFGFDQPIVVDESNVILKGHGRRLAALQLGLAKVPVLVRAGLSESDKIALRIMDNKSAESDFLPGELATDFKYLDELDYDLTLTGFDVDEISTLLADLEAQTNTPTQEPSPIIKGATLAQLKPSRAEIKAFKGKKIVVEFSGGKDSSAAAVWCRHFFPDNGIELVFFDLGADFVGFSLFLNEIASALSAPLTVRRSPQNIIDVFLQKGKWPHWQHPYCHDILHGTLRSYQRESLTAKGDYILIRGGRLQERARGKPKHGSRFPTGKWTNGYKWFQPLYFGDKGTSERIIAESNIPIWDGYSRGLGRTACRCCPGQKPTNYSAIRSNFPDVWDELIALEKILGPGCWQNAHKDGAPINSFAEYADKGDDIILAKSLP